MTKEEKLQIRINSELKSNFEQICDKEQISMSNKINEFIKNEIKIKQIKNIENYLRTEIYTIEQNMCKKTLSLKEEYSDMNLLNKYPEKRKDIIYYNSLRVFENKKLFLLSAEQDLIKIKKCINKIIEDSDVYATDMPAGLFGGKTYSTNEDFVGTISNFIDEERKINLQNKKSIIYYVTPVNDSDMFFFKRGFIKI